RGWCSIFIIQNVKISAARKLLGLIDSNSTTGISSENISVHSVIVRLINLHSPTVENHHMQIPDRTIVGNIDKEKVVDSIVIGRNSVINNQTTWTLLLGSTQSKHSITADGSGNGLIAHIRYSSFVNPHIRSLIPANNTQLIGMTGID